MPYKFNMMSFARLRYADKQYVEDASRHPDGRRGVLNELKDYLAVLADGDVIDYESAFLLGRELRAIWPFEHLDELISKLDDKTDIAQAFLAGLTHPRPPRTNDTRDLQPNHDSSLKRLLSQLGKGSFRSIEPQLEDLFQEYVSYVERSGYSQKLCRFAGQICETIFRTPHMEWSDRQHAAIFARRAALSALRWEPWNEYVWSLWARAYLAQGATEPAELIYWDAIRRFDRNTHLRNQLVGLLQRFETRTWEAIELARESFALFPNDAVTQNVLATALLKSSDPANHAQAIDLLLIGLRKFENSHLQVAINLLGGALGAEIPLTDAAEKYGDIARRIPDDDVLFGRIGKVITQQSAGIELGETFFRVGVNRFPRSAGLRNQLARILVATGSPDKRTEAIKLLRETTTWHPSDTHSRNQLAQALVVSGTPQEKAEAIELLQETIENGATDNKFSRELLKKLIEGEEEEQPHLKTNSAEKPEEDLDPPISHLNEPLSPELTKLARLRRLRFLLDHSRGTFREEALKELHQILANDPTFAYAQLLAVRQGAWVSAPNVVTSFAAAFELALSDQDREVLVDLGKRFPRLEALTIFARAIFGDRGALKECELISSQSSQAQTNVERALIERVGPMLRLVASGKIEKSDQQKAFAELRAINEAAIGSDAWRMAA